MLQSTTTCIAFNREAEPVFYLIVIRTCKTKEQRTLLLCYIIEKITHITSHLLTWQTKTMQCNNQMQCFCWEGSPSKNQRQFNSRHTKSYTSTIHTHTHTFSQGIRLTEQQRKNQQQQWRWWWRRGRDNPDGMMIMTIYMNSCVFFFPVALGIHRKYCH